jgi:hypothetical protein
MIWSTSEFKYQNSKTTANAATTFGIAVVAAMIHGILFSLYSDCRDKIRHNSLPWPFWSCFMAIYRITYNNIVPKCRKRHFRRLNFYYFFPEIHWTVSLNFTSSGWNVWFSFHLKLSIIATTYSRLTLVPLLGLVFILNSLLLPLPIRDLPWYLY